MNGSCRCGSRFLGRENHCPVCHESFASEGAGDSHRIGPYDPPGLRRCRSVDELRDGGMWSTVNRFGTTIWHGKWNKAGVQRRRVVG
jgi:hypothetical protein